MTKLWYLISTSIFHGCPGLWTKGEIFTLLSFKFIMKRRGKNKRKSITTAYIITLR